jgi:hypothetical protein
MRRMVGGMQYVKKFHATSAVHVELGDRKGNPSKQLAAVLHNRTV